MMRFSALVGEHKTIDMLLKARNLLKCFTSYVITGDDHTAAGNKVSLLANYIYQLIGTAFI